MSEFAQTSNDPFGIMLFGGQDRNEKANFHGHYSPLVEEGLSPDDKAHKGDGIYNVMITPKNIYFYNRGFNVKNFNNGKTRWEKAGVDFTIERKK